MFEDDRTNEEKTARMKELMAPIEQQLMMCDDEKDQLMMASAMLTFARDIFDLHIGPRGRKIMFKEMT
jgi:hypothetical protein